MTPTTVRSNCRFHSNARRGGPPGYALITLMIMVAVLLVSLTAALPSLYQEGQREREAEAIFRGEQYARAVYLFYRQFGRYPTSVKDLLNTSGTRFLREPYSDPLSSSGRWRFIHAAAGGVLIDSWDQKTLTAAPGTTGASPQAPGAGSSASASQSNPFGGSIMNGMSGTANAKPKHPPSTCDPKNDSLADAPDGKHYQTGVLMGAFIVGVAPCSGGQSIRVLDSQDHYDHWEFIGLKYREYSLPKSSAPGTAPAPLQPAPASNPTGLLGGPTPGAGLGSNNP